MKNTFDLRELVENAKDMQNIVDDESTIEDSETIKKKVHQVLQYCLSHDNCLLRKNDINNYKQKCMKEFPDFHGRYPTLFFAMIENPTTFPLYRLNEMFQIKKKVEENKIDKDTASAALGQKYYNEFVKDTVAELDKKL